MCILQNSTDLLSSLHVSHLGVHKATSIQAFNFSTLYTSIPHDSLKSRMNNIINYAFKHKNVATRYIHIKVGGNKSYFTNDPLNGDNKYTANGICKMIEFLVDNIYVRFGGQLFRQIVGIPVGTNCAHFWLTCFSIPMRMSFYINSFKRRAKESLLGSSIYHIVTLMTLSLSIIKDLRSSCLIFSPKNSQFPKPQNLPQLFLYLDLLFTRDKSNNITTKLFGKRDEFGFHIVNFPFYVNQYSISTSLWCLCILAHLLCLLLLNYSDFLLRHRALVTRLLSQGYKVDRLSNTFKKFYGRHTELVGQYKKNVCQMFADSISKNDLFFMDLLMAELIKLGKMAVSCMRQIKLTLSGAPGDCID